MKSLNQLWLGGEWAEPHGTERLTLFDPRDGRPSCDVQLADAVDVDTAVSKARQLFDDGPEWPLSDRLRALTELADIIECRIDEFAETLAAETGAPPMFAKLGQAGTAINTLRGIVEAGHDYTFHTAVGDSVAVAEPAGVVAAIAPWNFPLHQALGKVASALVCGCPVVLKPAELTPMSAYLLAEVAQEAGIPDGWLSVLAGRGDVAGTALVQHPQVDMISFTGSTAVGQTIAAAAGATLKRVALELGGKSPSVLLDDLDDDAFENAVATSLRFCLMNAGQTCAAWTRLVVPESRYDEACTILRTLAVTYVPGENLGPLVSAAQWDRVTGFLRTGVEEGAEVVYGDPAPSLPASGYYLTPVVFGRVTPSMRIGQEEIFGPVLAVQTHTSDDDAVRIANSTPYGLGGGVFGSDEARAYSVARRIRSGSVHINGLNSNRAAPFGGFKNSGIGREFGCWGLEEFLEVKSIQPPAGFAFPALSSHLPLEQNS